MNLKTHQYNREERKIANRLYDLKKSQKRTKKLETFDNYGAQISLLITKLGGKYNGSRS